MKKNISLILVLMVLALTLTGCSGTAYNDGEYKGNAEGFNPMEVSVKVEDGKITSVEILEEDETEEYAAEALSKLPQTIVDKNSTDVDVISGATLTSEGIINAVKDALEEAK